jgi:hypothetical protein
MDTIIMKIVVNHLTRMQKGFMCVAGIDLDSRLHIRPVLDRQMPTKMLAEHGGPFALGRIIDIGQTSFVGKVPEVEDQRINPDVVEHVDDMPDVELLSLMTQIAHNKLGAIFGPELKRAGSTCVVPATQGLRSLGCYWAQNGRLFIEQRESRQRIRFSWQAGPQSFCVPVTDIRLYADDHVTPSVSRVQQMAERIAALPRVLVAVGLSRAFRKTSSADACHWLQLNNFHLPE